MTISTWKGQKMTISTSKEEKIARSGQMMATAKKKKNEDIKADRGGKSDVDNCEQK